MKTLNLLPKSLRFYFVRLRLSVHTLTIKLGRYKNNKTRHDQRFCPLCNTSDIEDEFHFCLYMPVLQRSQKKVFEKVLLYPSINV